MPANQLIYLSYGTGPHVDEAKFSVLSALARDGGRSGGYDVVVVTDDPAPYADLGVAVEAVTAGQVRAWAGPADFNHRIKIAALAHVMRTRGGPAAVLVDGDTYHLKSPAVLFDRVGPGRSLMHVREGRIGGLVALGYDRQRLMRMTHDLGTSGGAYGFDADTPMWNAGVVGLAAADVGLLDEVLALTDAIHTAVPTKVSEQLAFSRVLGRRTRLAGCRDAVFHYHQAFLRDPFRGRLPGALRDTAALPPADRGRALHAIRPRATLAKTVKAAVKRRLKPLGLFGYDLETSI